MNKPSNSTQQLLDIARDYRPDQTIRDKATVKRVKDLTRGTEIGDKIIRVNDDVIYTHLVRAINERLTAEDCAPFDPATYWQQPAKPLKVVSPADALKTVNKRPKPE